MKHTPEILSHSAVGRFVEAYRNPRLEDPESDYFNPEHIRELQYGSEIVDSEEYRRPSVFPGIGTVLHIAFETRQGCGYKALRGIPEKQQTASLGLATSPLGTGAGGINMHLLLNYMRAGNFVGFIANEGSHAPFEDRNRKLRTSLASTAAALLSFGKWTQADLTNQGYDIDETDRFAYGMSKAGAVALLTNVLDQHFNQHIKASDIIAPSPTIKLDSASKWFQVAEQVAKEPTRAPFIISKLGLMLALEYRKSVSLSPSDLTNHLEICGGIFNGELGVAAKRIPADHIVRITEYEGDITCNDGGLEQCLTPETHPNVSFEQLPGIHFSIADKGKTLPVMMGFVKAFQEFDNGIINSSQELFQRARYHAPRQFPITEEQAPSSQAHSAA